MIHPGLYKHAKTGRLYRVHFVAKHSETLEEFVAYEALYENPTAQFWIRPATMFEEKVQIGDALRPRFLRVSDS